MRRIAPSRLPAPPPVVMGNRLLSRFRFGHNADKRAALLLSGARLDKTAAQQLTDSPAAPSSDQARCLPDLVPLLLLLVLLALLLLLLLLLLSAAVAVASAASAPMLLMLIFLPRRRCIDAMMMRVAAACRCRRRRRRLLCQQRQTQTFLLQEHRRPLTTPSSRPSLMRQ